METPSAVAADVAEIAEAANGSETGSSGVDRSLTLPNAQGKSSLEQALEAEESLEKQEAEATSKEESATDEPPAEASNSEADEPSEATESEAESETEDNDAVLKDEKGRAYVRPARLKKLLEIQAKHEELVEKLTQRSLEKEAPSKEEAEIKPGKDQVDPQVRVEAARKALQAAKESYDDKAIADATEELMDAKVEAKLSKVTEQTKKESHESGWKSEFDKAEETHSAVRNELWKEDVARFKTLDDPDLDLNDKESPFYQAVKAQVDQWHKSKDPIALSRNLFRRAIEATADRYNIPLPEVTKTAPKAASPAAPSVKSNANLRKNGTVIAGPTPGGKPPVTNEQLINELNKMKPADRLAKLAEIQEMQLSKERR